MAKGFISDDDLQKVRDATDIVALFGERTQIKQRGRDFWCCCPFHNEKTPSCKLDPATQLWHCFGCGEGGDVFSYVMKSEDVGFTDAVKYLADRANIDLKFEKAGGVPSSRKQRLRDICEHTARFYHDQLMRGKSDGAASARAYLAGRGFGGEVPKRWLLGYAPGRETLMNRLSQLGFSFDEMMQANVVSKNSSGRYYDRFFNRIMFPILDAQGNFIAFGGRVIGKGEPKYLNSQETPLFHKSNVLYGLDKAKASMTSTGTAIVVEGYTDVIALAEAGISNVVATLGTALTMSHIRSLSKHAGKRIVYLFDGDSAGQRAADRALQFIDADMTPEAGKGMIDLCAVTLPDDLDPAEFVGSRGADALKDLIDSAKPLLEYGIERRLSAFDLSTAMGRSAAAAEALSILAPIKDSILAKDYAVLIASRVHAREADILAQLASLKAAPRAAAADVGASGEPSPVSARTHKIDLSRSELNRLNIERVFLGLCAQNPLHALRYVNSIAKTNWRDRLHRVIAQCLVSVLAENPAASAAEVIFSISETEPRAASILTGVSIEDEDEIDAHLVFYSEELEIGDLNDAMDELRAKNAVLTASDTDIREQNERYIVEISEKLGDLRRSHKPRA